VARHFRLVGLNITGSKADGIVLTVQHYLRDIGRTGPADKQKIGAKDELTFLELAQAPKEQIAKV